MTPGPMRKVLLFPMVVGAETLGETFMFWARTGVVQSNKPKTARPASAITPSHRGKVHIARSS
jgi:hypothetical protein